MQQVEHRAVRYGTRRAPDSSRKGAGLRQARRAANRKQSSGDLRCECAELGCRAAIPAAAEGHRGMHAGFLVVPGHHGQDLVIAAADRFFLVEPKRIAGTS